VSSLSVRSNKSPGTLASPAPRRLSSVTTQTCGGIACAAQYGPRSSRRPEPRAMGRRGPRAVGVGEQRHGAGEAGAELSRTASFSRPPRNILSATVTIGWSVATNKQRRGAARGGSEEGTRGGDSPKARRNSRLNLGLARASAAASATRTYHARVCREVQLACRQGPWPLIRWRGGRNEGHVCASGVSP